MKPQFSDRDFIHGPPGSFSSMPATDLQWKSAFAVLALLLIAFIVIAPMANRPLPHLGTFITIVYVVMITTNFVTAYLLFSTFKLFGGLGILMLACGYLIPALAMVPYIMSFPGAITSDRLIGGLQATPWIYAYWHFAFAIAVVLYAWLKNIPAEGDTQRNTTAVLCVSIGAVIALTSASVWLCLAADTLFPVAFHDNVRATSIVAYCAGLIALSNAAALGFLWVRRRSVIDVWLTVALGAGVLEPIIGSVLISERFTVGFYCSRIFAVVTSTVVLGALLSNIVRLHRKLEQSIDLLQRERRSKMVSIDAVTASIAHEVRQPLAAIATNGSAALRLIDHSNPDLSEIREAMKAIVHDSLDANQVLEGIRSLFRAPGSEPEQLDINDIVRSALRMSRSELTEGGIQLYTALASDIPLIVGHKTQLREVVSNLIQNAAEAMHQNNDRPKIMRLATETHGSHSVSISIDDSGPGISPERLQTVFDVFITTKPRGMGLGLAISRMIVERRGGHIAFPASQYGGACFKVVLPLRYEPQ